MIEIPLLLQMFYTKPNYRIEHDANMIWNPFLYYWPFEVSEIGHNMSPCKVIVIVLSLAAPPAATPLYLVWMLCKANIGILASSFEYTPHDSFDWG